MVINPCMHEIPHAVFIQIASPLLLIFSKFKTTRIIIGITQSIECSLYKNYLKYYIFIIF